jgi:hypothetical protein
LPEVASGDPIPHCAFESCVTIKKTILKKSLALTVKTFIPTSFYLFKKNNMCIFPQLVCEFTKLLTKTKPKIKTIYGKLT